MDTITRCYSCAPALIAWLYKQLHVIDEDLVRDVFEKTLQDLDLRSPNRIINEVKSPGGVTEKILDQLDDIEINKDHKIR